MQRRDFITFMGGAVASATWPLAARAQKPAWPTIGFLHPGSPEANAHVVTPFREGLADAGFVEGQNLAIEFRWAYGDGGRLKELAADLVRRRVAVIAVPNGTPAPLAAQAATSTIPIVFQIAADPVETGLVASMNRPGGNVTGISSMNRELNLKRLGLLRELLPAATRFGLLFNADADPALELTLNELRTATAALGGQVEILTPRTSQDIDAAFAMLAQKRVEAVIVSSGPALLPRRVQLALLTAQHKVAAIYTDRQFPEAGGLMSYGANLAAMFRQTGVYVGRILKGEKPAELPVLQPTRFDFIINLVAARALGLEIPTTLLARADEVIE